VPADDVCSPARLDILATPQPNATWLRERARPPVVLVADDNADARELLGVHLGMLGCRVVHAENGREAVELARRFRPDLVLLDMWMPEMDGIQATRELRRDPQTKDLHLIGYTASGREWLDAARAAGCDGVLEKPVFLDHLQRVVDEVLAARALRGPEAAP
jgi:CheY-like chemotaxis protein